MKGITEMREKCKEIKGELYAIGSYEGGGGWYVLEYNGHFWQQVSPTYAYRGWAVRFMNNI